MAADYTQFATGEHVQDVLTLAGFWPTDADEQALAESSAQDAAAAAARRFQERCGWFPFLKGEEETRDFYVSVAKFNATKIVPLKAGLLSLSAIALNDEDFALTNGTAIPPVIKMPTDASYKGKPWQVLRFPFVRRVVGISGMLKISVTGEWGYCETVPEDTWLLSLSWACVECFTKLNIEQDIASISDPAGFTKAWDIVGTVTPKDLLLEWPRREKEVIKQYEYHPLPGIE